MSNKKKPEKKSGLWAFLTQSAKSPTSYDVFVSLAKAELLLERVRAIYRQQDNFEKETKRIQDLRVIMSKNQSDSVEYKKAQKELYKILKL
jgi:hypothetical protein